MPDRNSIAESMVWCIETAECAEEVVECLVESLSIQETPIVKKIARLFLISDILHNCTVKGVPNVSFYRTAFQARLPEVFVDLHKTFKNMPESERRQAEAFKQRVMSVFSAWEDWHLYPMDFLIKCQNLFLGLVGGADDEGDEAAEAAGKESEASDDDVDGLPLDAAATLAAKGGSKGLPGISGMGPGSDSEDSADGKPLDGGMSSSISAPAPPAGAFIKSKWETVDPEQVKAQAVTTSKWDREENDELVKARKALMGSVASKWEKGSDDSDDDLDGVPLERRDTASELDMKAAEERRQILRDIEVKVMAYQDELETGDKGIKSGWSIAEQVEHYRKKLLRKALDQTAPSTPVSNTSNNHRNNTSSTTDRDHHNRDSEDSDSKSSRSSKKKKRKRERSSSSGSDDRNNRGRSRSRSRGGNKSKNKKRSRDRSGSGSPDGRRKRDRSSRSPKRSKRSRSRSQKKSKKKRR